MSDREQEWIEKIAKAVKLSEAKSTEGDKPYCLVQTGRNKIEIALCSDLEPPLKIGDLAVVTVSPQKFVLWTKIFGKIVEDAHKKS